MFDKLFKRKSKEPLPDFSDVKVTLPTILGVRPGIYLMVIYGVIALLLIFLLFFMPGLRDAGSYLNFRSQPLPAGVWIDGQKAGVTPCEVLVKEGRHQITLSRPGFKPIVMERDVTRYVFALPFLPKREYIDVGLEVKDINELARGAYRDFTEWALVEAFAADYPYPPVLSDAAKSMYASPGEETYRVLSELLERALPAAHLPELAADWLDAYVTVECRGRALTPGAAFRLVSGLRRYAARYDNLPFLCYTVLPKELGGGQAGAAPKGPALTSRDALEKTKGFQAKVEAYKRFLAGFAPVSGARPVPSFSLEGVSFLPVPGGTFLMGGYSRESSLLGPNALNVFPHPMKLEGFSMAQTEVTNRQFRLFLEENPEWRPENRDALMKKELADEFYLSDWKDGTYPEGKGSMPVTYVSAFAAEAYCQWLTKKLGARLPGAVVRLPYEAEWEWAAAGGSPGRFKTPGSRLYTEFQAGLAGAGASAPNLFGLSDMAGNAFEWCRDWYADCAPLVSSSRPGNNPYDRYEPFTAGGAKVVRGGSWATPAEEIEVFTRGSQPPSWGTPFLGFRPVIAAR